MRLHAKLAMAAVAALFVVAVPVAVSIPAYSQVDCEELRRACQMKDRLGERGEGNCRRYRENCQRAQRVDCQELRAACLNKGAGRTGRRKLPSIPRDLPPVVRQRELRQLGTR